MKCHLSNGLVSLWFNRWRTASAGFCFLGLLLTAPSAPLSAQYALTETGARIGLGALIPYGADRWQAGPSLGLSGFYTHYICGKRSGYWLEATLQQHFFQEKAGSEPSLFSDIATGENHYSLLNLQLAALYKYRAVNYHRPREWALLIGPKLDLSLNPRVAADAEGSRALSDSTTRRVGSFWLGIHLGTVYRRPMGKSKNSLLFFAGVDWYPLALAERSGTGRDTALRGLAFTLGVGATIWDNR